MCLPKSYQVTFKLQQGRLYLGGGLGLFRHTYCAGCVWISGPTGQILAERLKGRKTHPNSGPFGRSLCRVNTETPKPFDQKNIHSGTDKNPPKTSTQGANSLRTELEKLRFASGDWETYSPKCVSLMMIYHGRRKKKHLKQIKRQNFPVQSSHHFGVTPEVKAVKNLPRKLPFRTSDRCPKRMRKRAARLAVRCAAGGGVSSAEARKVL